MRRLSVREAKQYNWNAFLEKEKKNDSQYNCSYASTLICFPGLNVLSQNNNLHLLNFSSGLTF